MSKQSPIRVRGQDKELIKQINKQISNKKSKLKTRYGIMTEFETTPISQFKTRKEFNRYKQQAEKFLEQSFKDQQQYYRNAHGKLLDIEEVKEVKRLINKRNRIEEKEKQRLIKAGIIDEEELKNAWRLGDVRFSNFKPIKFNLNRFRSVKEFEKYKEEVQKRYGGDIIKTQNEQYRENILSALEKVFGGNPQIEKDYHRLYEHIQNLSINDVITNYYTKNLTNIRFIYDQLDLKYKFNRIMSEWGIKR